MRCRYCSEKLVKRGFQKNGLQKYYCKKCLRFQQRKYSSKAYEIDLNQEIVKLHCLGLGITGISSYLSISRKTVSRRILEITKTLKPPVLEENRSYQVDELWTYAGSKRNPIWVMYAIDSATGKPISLIVGKRTKLNLRKVLYPILNSHPIKIFTDRLLTYKKMIPSALHRTHKLGNQKIERFNLTLRTHLKRLGRKTICYSKSIEMLEASLKLYFWS